MTIHHVGQQVRSSIQNNRQSEALTVQGRAEAKLGDKKSDIPEDISKEIGSTTPKNISTDETGKTTFELHSTKGLKVTMTPPEEMCDGSGETKWEVTSNDGTKRELTDDEKKALAKNLDRNLSGHDLKGDQAKAGREMLNGLLPDPAIDARWDAPNVLKDAALSEGKVTDRYKGNGLALGRKEGPLETLTLTNGNSAELKVIRESAPNGPGSTPLFSKGIASGDYEHLVPLSRDEAVALRQNLRKQGPQFNDTVKDLDRYIRSLNPMAANDTFERTNNTERDQYRRYIG